MYIMREFLKEDGMFQSLFILSLVFQSAGKYRYNQLKTLNTLTKNQMHVQGCQEEEELPEIHGSLNTPHWFTNITFGI